MSNITGNEPAMPLSIASDVNNIYSTLQANGGEALCGLTIRQEFAARAMQGLLSSLSGSINLAYEGIGRNSLDNLVADAVCIADALLAELNKS